MDICVLQHQDDSPAALFADWAAKRGHTLTVLAAPKLERWPDQAAHDAVVSLGSDCSVYGSPDTWIAQETAFLRAVHDAGVPVLGICFGGQALAKALGGEVAQAPRVEAGWYPIDTAAPDLIPPGPWFRWHEDVFIAPPGARELARNDIGVLAFVQGQSIGLQVHPEVDVALARRWVEPNAGRLLAQGIDHEAVLTEIAAAGPAAPERADDLFDRIAAHWASTSVSRRSRA
jgi:GMP synthase-like glutamine amidotransferase